MPSGASPKATSAGRGSALAEQLNLGQFYSELSPEDQCAVKGYSEGLIRLFEKEKSTDED